MPPTLDDVSESADGAPRSAVAAWARDLTVTYRQTRALDGLNISINTGRLTCVLGPNGAGKSTTFAVLAGLAQPTSGSAELLGRIPGSAGARDRLGVMLQEGGVSTGATGSAVVRHIAALREAPQTASHWIETLGIAAMGRTTFRRMSGGQKKRVALACALVGHPQMVLVDEPTAGLDPPGRRLVWEILTTLRDQGVTVVMNTHDLAEAERLADDIVIIEKGRCVLSSSLDAALATVEESVDFDAPLHLDVGSLEAALTFGSQVEERSPGQYRIVGDVSPQTLATVTAWCSQHGVTPRALRIGSARLEDLYWDMVNDASKDPR